MLFFFFSYLFLESEKDNVSRTTKDVTFAFNFSKSIRRLFMSVTYYSIDVFKKSSMFSHTIFMSNSETFSDAFLKMKFCWKSILFVKICQNALNNFCYDWFSVEWISFLFKMSISKKRLKKYCVEKCLFLSKILGRNLIFALEEENPWICFNKKFK